MNQRSESSPQLCDDEPLRWEEWLQPGDHIFCSHMTSEPRALLASLASADLPDALSIELGVPFSTDTVALPDTVSLQVMGGMGAAGSLSRQRHTIIDRAEYLEILLDYASGRRQADVVLVSLAQAADGSLHLGACHGPIVEAARNARIVIAEINATAPVIKGSAWPDEIAITRQIPCNYTIAAPDTAIDQYKIKTHELKIAQHLAGIIPDGACLQVGIGTLPSAILGLLKHHQNLGIHTGMLSESLYELISCGAVNNSRKPIEFQHAVTGCVYGSASLYESVAANNQVVLASPRQTHSLDVLQKIDSLVTINSATEIDLTGRTNAETIKTQDGLRRYVGGVGGLPAFVRGALAAKNGISVIALPALTQYGDKQNYRVSQSRIVSSLEAEVTLDRTLADIVVTEFGVANLRGASPTQRKQRLIGIADPGVRDGLRR